MKLLAKLAIAVAVNAFALIATVTFVPGATVAAPDLKNFVIAAAILTVLNLTIKPILKLMLGPVIVLTLGLGLVAVNAAVLFILDMLSKNLTIDGVSALFLGALIIGAANLILHIATA